MIADKSKTENSVEIIEKIVTGTALANKWLMWCESNCPDKTVFVPSIFQMRDAFSHIIKIFGNGINLKIISNTNEDFNSLLKNEESIKQLELAFGHCARAFFDCADYIILTLKKEVDKGKSERNAYLQDLQRKMEMYDNSINELRIAKSEDSIGNFEAILKWDRILQSITCSYIIGDLVIRLLDIISKIKIQINYIEKNYPTDIILNHYPKFYERKKIICEIETLPQELTNFYQNESSSLEQTEIIEDPQAWNARIEADLNDKIKKGTEYSIELDVLQKVMSNTKAISSFGKRKKNVIKAIWGGISIILSWIITNLLSNVFLIKTTTNLPEQTQTMTVDKLNLSLLFPFLVLCALFFIIGTIIYKLWNRHKRS